MKKISALFLSLFCCLGIALGQTHTFPALDTNNNFTGSNTFTILNGNYIAGNAPNTTIQLAITAACTAGGSHAVFVPTVSNSTEVITSLTGCLNVPVIDERVIPSTFYNYNSGTDHYVAFTSGSGFPIQLGTTSIAAGSSTTAVSGLEVNGVTLTAAGVNNSFLNAAGVYNNPSTSSVAAANGLLYAQSVVGNNAIVPHIHGNSFSVNGFGTAPYDGWVPRMLVAAGLYSSVAQAIQNQNQWLFAVGGNYATDVTYLMMVNENPQSFFNPTVFNIAMAGNNLNPTDTTGPTQDTMAGEVWSGSAANTKVVFGSNDQVSCTGTTSTNTDFPNVNGINMSAGSVCTWTVGFGAQNVFYLVAESHKSTTGSGTLNVKCLTCASGTTPLVDTFTNSSTLNPWISTSRFFPSGTPAPCPVLPGWQKNIAYAANTYILDSNSNVQKVTVAGTSGSTPPIWNTSGTTSDASPLVWTYQFPAVSCSGVAYRFANLNPTSPGQQTIEATALTGNVTILFAAYPLVSVNGAAITGPRLIVSSVPQLQNLVSETYRIQMNDATMAGANQMLGDGFNIGILDLSPGRTSSGAQTGAINVPYAYLFNTTPLWSGAPTTNSLNYSITSNVVTMNLAGTCTGCTAGLKVYFNDCQLPQFLNKQWVQATTWTATQIVFPVPGVSQPDISTTTDMACQLAPQASTNPLVPTSNNNGHGDLLWQDEMETAVESIWNPPPGIANIQAETINTSVSATTAMLTINMLSGNASAFHINATDGAYIDIAQFGDSAWHVNLVGGSTAGGDPLYFQNNPITFFSPTTIPGGQGSEWATGLGVVFPTPATPSSNSSPPAFTFNGNTLFGSPVAVTGFQITSNFVTFTGTNSYTTGTVFEIIGLTNAYMDGSYRITSSTGSTFTAMFTHADVAFTADSGSAYVTAYVGWSEQLTLGSGSFPTLAADLVFVINGLADGSSVLIPSLKLTNSTAHGTLIGQGSGAITSTAPGTSGYVWTSNGSSSDPTWRATNGPYTGTITLTTATSDSVSITGVTSSSKCGILATNSTAAGLTSVTLNGYYSVSSGTFTLNHAATTASGATYGVSCSGN